MSTSLCAHSTKRHPTIAALAIEHGGEVYLADTDFARFPGLRWTNPLV